MRPTTIRFNPFVALLFLGIIFSSNSFSQKKKLVMAVGLSLPPYVLSDTATGIELDYVRQIFKTAGYDVSFKFYPFARVPKEVRHGGDIDGALTVREETFQKEKGPFHFSKVYIKYENYAFTLKSSGLMIESVEDLARGRIKAFQNAKKYLGPNFASAVSKNKDYSETAKQVSQNIMLARGRIDVSIGDRRIFAYYQKQVKDVGMEQIQLHDIFPKTDYRMVFLDEAIAKNVNDAIAKEVKNDTLIKIEADYLKQNAKPLVEQN